MEINKKDILPYTIIIVFIFSVVIWALINKKQLKDAHEISIAKISDYTYGGRGHVGSLTLIFNFKIESKDIEGSTEYQSTDLSDSDVKLLFLGKSFPVTYNPNNPKNCLLLIKQKDFERFGYTFPDSLKWVSKYFKE